MDRLRAHAAGDGMMTIDLRSMVQRQMQQMARQSGRGFRRDGRTSRFSMSEHGMHSFTTHAHVQLVHGDEHTAERAESPAETESGSS